MKSPKEGHLSNDGHAPGMIGEAARGSIIRTTASTVYRSEQDDSWEQLSFYDATAEGGSPSIIATPPGVPLMPISLKLEGAAVDIPVELESKACGAHAHLGFLAAPRGGNELRSTSGLKTPCDSPTKAPSISRRTDLKELRDLKKKVEAREKELVQHAEEKMACSRRGSFSYGTLYFVNPRQQRVASLLSHWGFDFFIGICICSNAITIGLETMSAVRGEAVPPWVMALECTFLAVYTIELGLRFYAYELKALKSMWVRFDAFLVFCGILDLIVQLASETNDVLENVMLIRMLRLARLARAARLMIQFKVLWVLVQGLMNSMMTIIWTFVIITVLIYIFAVLGMELMKPDDSYGEEYTIAAANFNEGLGMAMLTLAQFLTLDSIGGIYRPVIKAKPMLAIYFTLFILLVSVALMNLVTAVMVDSALSQSSQDREAEKAWESAKKKSSMPQLKAMFKELDIDGSGELELQELRDAPEELKEQLQQIANMEDCEELFHMLDYDGSGTVEVDEFCEGVLKAASGNKPMELLRLVRQCADIQRTVRSVHDMVAPFPGTPTNHGRLPNQVLQSHTATQGSFEVLGQRVGNVEFTLANLDKRMSGLESDMKKVVSALCPGAQDNAEVPTRSSSIHSRVLPRHLPTLSSCGA